MKHAERTVAPAVSHDEAPFDDETAPVDQLSLEQGLELVALWDVCS